MSSESPPEGWRRVPLRDCLVEGLQTGFASGTNNRTGHGIAHIRPMNVSTSGRVVVNDLKFVPTDKVPGETGLLKFGDVVFNNTNSPELVGKTALYDLAEPRAFSNHMTRIRCKREVLDPHYCAYALHQKWRDGSFEAICNNHVSQASISREKLADTTILLPPVEEQRRIAAKLDDLLGRIAATRERLDRVPTILRRFRQTVLAGAVTGRLTEDVRGDVHIAPLADGAKDLPEGWTRKTFKDVCRDISVGYVGPMVQEYVDVGIPWLRSLNVKEFKLDLANLKFVSPAFHSRMKKTSLARGDVVIIRTGNAGKAAVIPQDLGEANCADLIIVRPAEQLDPDYATIYINCLTMRAHVEQEMVGIAQGHFNIGSMRRTSLPLPPVVEQREIARRTKKLLAAADAVEKRWESVRRRLDPLSQAILARAFLGELAS